LAARDTVFGDIHEYFNTEPEVKKKGKKKWARKSSRQ
jgi:hypothetical protein